MLFTVWFTLMLEKNFVKLFNTRKFDLSCTVDMYHLWEIIITYETKYLDE